MTLPFGTRVALNTDPTVIGVVVGVSSSTREGYAVAWPNGTRETRWRAELTVVPSPADYALSEIASLLGLPPDSEPKAVVDAVRAGIADPFKLVAPSFAGLFGGRGVK